MKQKKLIEPYEEEGYAVFRYNINKGNGKRKKERNTSEKFVISFSTLKGK